MAAKGQKYLDDHNIKGLSQSDTELVGKCIEKFERVDKDCSGALSQDEVKTIVRGTNMNIDVSIPLISINSLSICFKLTSVFTPRLHTFPLVLRKHGGLKLLHDDQNLFRSGYRLLLSRECLSHDTTYIRMSARKFESCVVARTLAWKQ